LAKRACARLSRSFSKRIYLEQLLSHDRRNPNEGWIKVNVDGAFNDKTNEMGIGVVI
jgi:hypothetical protein